MVGYLNGESEMQVSSNIGQILALKQIDMVALLVAVDLLSLWLVVRFPVEDAGDDG